MKGNVSAGIIAESLHFLTCCKNYNVSVQTLCLINAPVMCVRMKQTLPKSYELADWQALRLDSTALN
jgi:hypothetical protein